MGIKLQGIEWDKPEPVNTTNGTASSPVQSNCADIMFINLSPTNTYTIDGMPLPPGAVLVDGCNVGEYNTHTYTIQGAAPVQAGILLTGLFVRRKKYTRIIEIN